VVEVVEVGLGEGHAVAASEDPGQGLTDLPSVSCGCELAADTSSWSFA
jgi:hypothetical protein